MQLDHDLGTGAVEADAGIRIAYTFDGVACDGVRVNLCGCGDFTRNEHEVGGDQGFHSDPTIGILS